MWEISQEIAIAAEHQLRSAPTGDERGRHRHSWRIKAVVRARALDRSGWVLDFNALTAIMKAAFAPYDNAFLNEVPPFDDVEPTRERIAQVMAEQLAAKIDDDRVQLARLEIWESDTRCTTYFRQL